MALEQAGRGAGYLVSHCDREPSRKDRSCLNAFGLGGAEKAGEGAQRLAPGASARSQVSTELRET